MTELIKYVGLDVHKARTVVAIAESGLRGEVRDYGSIATTRRAIERLAVKLGEGGRQSCRSATRPGRAATASIVGCRSWGMTVSWWRHR